MLRMRAISLFVLIIGVVAQRDGVDFKHIKFEVFHPKGLEVSLPDDVDITSFSVDANINKPVRRHIPGVVANATNVLRGRYWTVEMPSVELKIGDEIYYTCFVAKANLGYYHSGSFHVKEYAVGEDDIEDSVNPQVRTKCLQDKSSQIDQCVRLLTNATEELRKHQDQISDLRNENRILKAMLENHSKTTFTEMKLSGVLPPDGSPLAIARDIVREKLKSSVKVLSAWKKGREIFFQVQRQADKLVIIKAAEKYLKYSKIVLSS